MPDRDAFLRRVDARLPFITEQREAVLEELRGHLDESVAGLIDSGWDPIGAEEEALRRLGDPDALARDIGRAQQTNRRLLAAAGAGVLNVGTSLLVSFALVVPPAFLVFAVSVTATFAIGGSVNGVLGSANGFSTAALLWVVAWVIGVRLPVALARSARRPLAWGRRISAFVVVPLVFVWVVAIVPAQHSLPSIIAFLATPVFGWIGVRQSQGSAPGFSIRRASAVIVLLLVGGLIADGLGPPRSGEWLNDPDWQDNWDPAAGNLALVGQLDRSAAQDRPRISWSHKGREFDVSVGTDQVQRETYPSLRVELWPATADLASVHPRATGPFTSVPLQPGTPDELVVDGVSLNLLGLRVGLFPHRLERPWLESAPPEMEPDQLRATISSARRLDWGEGTAWMVLVSEDPDGKRHVLDWQALTMRFGFSGSILEWLTADDSPAPIAPD